MIKRFSLETKNFQNILTEKSFWHNFSNLQQPWKLMSRQSNKSNGNCVIGEPTMCCVPSEPIMLTSPGPDKLCDMTFNHHVIVPLVRDAGSDLVIVSQISTSNRCRNNEATKEIAQTEYNLANLTQISVICNNSRDVRFWAQRG